MGHYLVAGGVRVTLGVTGLQARLQHCRTEEEYNGGDNHQQYGQEVQGHGKGGGRDPDQNRGDESEQANLDGTVADSQEYCGSYSQGQEDECLGSVGALYHLGGALQRPPCQFRNRTQEVRKGKGRAVREARSQSRCMTLRATPKIIHMEKGT